ncbi:hypothetical protein CPT_MarsHill_017 [Staphylococcus phage MarsHill]|nr:hypothetical protein CPT_MarsHill_017 [Staphylococcus phage MarsHill]QQO92674.1 hypothetical protein CPT_Madawaska_017 [Staphylococcus phage Madawaska]
MVREEKIKQLKKELQVILDKEIRSRNKSISNRDFEKKLDLMKQIDKLKFDIRSERYLRNVKKNKIKEYKGSNDYAKAGRLHQSFQSKEEHKIWKEELVIQ